MYHPQLLGRSFKKQEISHYVLFYNFQSLFLVLRTRGTTTAEKLKFWNLFRPSP